MNNPEIEIILPVYNEEDILENNTLKIKRFLEKNNFKLLISIVDNGSIDKTFEIAKSLEKRFSNIFAFKLNKKNKGLAIRFGILNSSAPLVGYMDIDLSTDLSYFLNIFNEICKGYDIVIGSRLFPSLVVQRPPLRKFLTKAYSKIVRYFLNLPFFDYQCGFKLLKRENIISIIPFIKNSNLFFDTELIFHAYRKGLKIKEIPISWSENRKKSRINLIKAAFEDIKGIWYLRRKFSI